MYELNRLGKDSTMSKTIGKFIQALFLMLLCVNMVAAQNRKSLLEGLEYNVSAEASATHGDKTPLWLNANKYGLSSLEKYNGYVRAGVGRPLYTDSTMKWGIGYGLDVAGAFHYTSKAIVQQAFVEGRWLKGVLTVGSKEYPMELKNNRLSSGSQALGINARPVPQVRIALPDYWDLPFTNGWVGIKGHIAYGMTTDGGWQLDFTGGKSKYTSNTLYHSKAGYIRIGNPYRFLPVSLELGLEMAAQFGGTSYNLGGVEGGMRTEMKNDGSLKAFWNVFIPGGSDASEDVYKNMSGNQIGTWMMRLNFDYDNWYLGIYGEHYFEDQSAMFHLDYDGYGKGDNWNVNEKRRYLLYDLKDMMLGIELKLKENRLWINDVVFEYLYTKYQSGPIYHDHNMNISDHIGGNDNYYNHSIFTGWQHWGQVMGNPLYMSPVYNDDGLIEVKNNRFYAFHLGIGGAPTFNLNYRLLATYQKGFGQYNNPYPNPRENVSVMAEAVYSFPESTVMNGWSVRAAVGMDRGKLLGDNYGVQLSVMKTGLLNFRK